VATTILPGTVLACFIAETCLGQFYGDGRAHANRAFGVEATASDSL